ncbi:MAG TPA: GTP-binding protein, partial [Candidatus Latescibacteria bacterium]|nr:GTP-binding protein [Candidatus Latescibacterota bacterium]
MNEHSANTIRNIAFVGHGGAGKTTFVEAVLYTLGVTTRMGSVTDGNTVSDYNADEQLRKFSLNATVLQFEAGAIKMNVIDTPGYTDFIGEAVGALRAVDNVAVFINAQTGVEVGTELIWGYAAEFHKPALIVINACSREHADFQQAVDQAKDRFGSSVVVCQFPVNQGEHFNQIVDVVTGKLYTYEPGGKGVAKISELSGELASRAQQMREALMEAVAESDEALLETYLEAGELEEDGFIAGLKAAIKNRMVYPVLASDAHHNVGTDRILEWIAEYLPSPADMGP